MVQYIHPCDAAKLGQAELVCIDEAAAIPLPLVKALLGPYLVFMSSTVNGSVPVSHVYNRLACLYGYLNILGAEHINEMDIGLILLCML